jgi:hypothetical protein
VEHPVAKPRAIQQADCLILGRTEAAFASHPQY